MMRSSLLNRVLFYALGFWPFAVAAVFCNVVLFSLGEEGIVPKLLFLAFLFGGICIQGLWLYYASHSGLTERAHNYLGIPRDEGPYR